MVFSHYLIDFDCLFCNYNMKYGIYIMKVLYQSRKQVIHVLMSSMGIGPTNFSRNTLLYIKDVTPPKLFIFWCTWYMLCMWEDLICTHLQTEILDEVNYRLHLFAISGKFVLKFWKMRWNNTHYIFMWYYFVLRPIELFFAWCPLWVFYVTHDWLNLEYYLF